MVAARGKKKGGVLDGPHQKKTQELGGERRKPRGAGCFSTRGGNKDRVKPNPKHHKKTSLEKGKRPHAGEKTSEDEKGKSGPCRGEKRRARGRNKSEPTSANLLIPLAKKKKHQKKKSTEFPFKKARIGYTTEPLDSSKKAVARGRRKERGGGDFPPNLTRGKRGATPCRAQSELRCNGRQAQKNDGLCLREGKKKQ